MKTCIRVLNGEALGKKVLLDLPVVTCGRHFKNDLTLADENASRHHCRFVLDNDARYLIEDVGSSNGTYVNEVLIRSQVLQVGDQIRIGDTLLEVATTDEDLFEESNGNAQFDGVGSEAELVPEVPAANPVLDILIESYPEIVNEQSFVESKVDLDYVCRASLIASKNQTLESLCCNLAKLVSEWASVEQPLLVLLDEHSNNVSQSFTSQVADTAPPSKPLAIKLNREIVDRVLDSRLPSMSEFEIPAELSQKVTAMCVPVSTGEKLLGFLYVDNLKVVDETHESVFTGSGLDVLAAIGKQAAAAIENNTFVRTALEDARSEAVGRLTSVVSHRVNNLLYLINGGEFLIETGMESNSLPQIAKGWSIVKRAQYRITKLSTNMALQCQEFHPVLREMQPNTVIDQVADELASDFGETRTKVVHRTAPDFSLSLDGHYFDIAIRNVLAVVQLNADLSEGRAESIELETSLIGNSYVIRASFYRVDDRLEFAILGTGELNKFNVEQGFLEILVSRKIAESHGGSLSCSTDSDNLNTIEIRFPNASTS